MAIIKKSLYLAILFSLLASPAGDFAFAKIEITDEDAERLSTAFDLLKTFGNAVLPQELKNILNTTVKGADIGTDITYGVLVLSATNEMELIDMVVSQRYKTISDKYFHSILNENTDIYKHYKNIAFDIPKLLFNTTITGPISALTLNTFSLESKTIQALLALHNLNETMTYNGLWVYFDQRRGGNEHEFAWELAKTEIGVAATRTRKSLTSSKTEEESSELALQFASLWKNWKDKTTAFGVKPEVKQAFNKEIQALALEAAGAYAQQKQEPSFIAKISNIITSFIQQATEGIKNVANNVLNTIRQLGSYVGKLNPFGAGLSKVQNSVGIESSIQIVNEDTKAPVQVRPIQEDQTQATKPPTPSQPLPTPKPVIQPQPEEVKVVEEKPAPLPTSLCNISSSASPSLNSVVFNEIAWMGTQNSANDEWVELKNISNSPVKLEGWQLRDKDDQIHIVFDISHSIPANGLFLLERTDDNTLPGISADAIYKGALGNTNEELFLLNKDCALQDKAQANPEWPVGDNNSKRTMERKTDKDWQTSLNPGGTPKTENSKGYIATIPTVSTSGGGGGGGTIVATTTATTAPTTSTPTTYSTLLIAEIQTAGQSSQTEEFVELYNPNATDMSLTNWYLQKKTANASEFSSFVSSTFFAGKTILSKGYVLIARTGSSFANTADILTESSLADNNTLALKNPNGDIVDKVGWGTVSDFEGSPAQNPQAGKSLARKYGSNYQDTDNNAQDFEERTPTPKVQNTSSSSIPSDTEAPTVSFSALPEIFNTTLFSLSWQTPDSDIDHFSLNYSVTPNTDGILLQYKNNGNWIDWNQGATNALSLSSGTTNVSTTAQDGLTYIFTITATDTANNESVSDTATTKISLSKTVVINEIAWAGATASTANEWIELYNTSNNEIDLSGWSIYGADTDKCINFAEADNFEEGGENAAFRIGPDNYLVYGNNLETVKSDSGASLVAIQDATIGLNNSNPGQLRLYDHNDCAGTMIDEANQLAGNWFAGENTAKQTMERISFSASGSETSNWASNNLITHNGREAGGIIFINGTPGAQNSVSKTETEITDIRLSEFDRITLTFLGNPYTTDASIIVPQGKTLILEPGVMLRIAQQTSSITIQGTLKASGTVEKNITLTSSLSGSQWCGLTFTSTSVDSELDYITIEKATGCGDPPLRRSVMVDGSNISLKHATLTQGDSKRKIYLKNSSSIIDFATISGANNPGDPEAAGILIEGTGNPTITNSTFSNNTIGIWHKSPTANPTISNNTFTGNTYPIKLTSAPAILSGNSASGNTYNGILLEGATISDFTLETDTIPYIIDDFTVQAGKILTLKPGAIIKFVNFGTYNPVLRIYGTLSAQGTQSNPITFTGLGDSSVGGTTALNAGQSWRGIVFYPGSTGTLDYTTVKKGGTLSEVEGMIQVDQSAVSISNSNLQQSGKKGIYSSSGNITIQDTTIEVPENSYAFYIQNGNCPTLTNVSITGLGQTLAPNSVACSL